MFSNINEAWKNDPVKEITNKLSRGAFSKQNEHTNIFNFKNKSKKDIVSLSDNSLSLLSENTINSDDIIVGKNGSTNGSKIFSDMEYGPFAPANLDKYPEKNKKIYHKSKHPSITSLSNINSTESNLFDTIEDSRCDYSVKHLNKCDKCYYKLKRMIDNKVNRKYDDMVVNYKLQQLQNNTANNNQSHPVQSAPQSDSWKETLIIVIGAIIAIFIIFLIVKSIGK